MSDCTQTQPNCEEPPEYEFSKNETVDTDCGDCGETFSFTPDGGWLIWYAYEVECPNCYGEW
jgi:hypothetical protein